MGNPVPVVFDTFGMVTDKAVRVTVFRATFGGDQVGYANLSPDKARKLARRLNEAADATEEWAFGSGVK